MSDDGDAGRTRRFREAALPHLDDVYTLARYLLRITGDGRYGDGLERDVFNLALAVRDPDSDGDYPYYSTYGPAAQKRYYGKKWPCCSGTLATGRRWMGCQPGGRGHSATWVMPCAGARRW